MDRYIYADHPTKFGWRRIVDTEWSLTCDYEIGKFNSTQEFPKLGLLVDNPLQAAKVMRELGEFISANDLD